MTSNPQSSLCVLGLFFCFHTDALGKHKQEPLSWHLKAETAVPPVTTWGWPRRLTALQSLALLSMNSSLILLNVIHNDGVPGWFLSVRTHLYYSSHWTGLLHHISVFGTFFIYLYESIWHVQDVCASALMSEIPVFYYTAAYRPANVYRYGWHTSQSVNHNSALCPLVPVWPLFPHKTDTVAVKVLMSFKLVGGINAQSFYCCFVISMKSNKTLFNSNAVHKTGRYWLTKSTKKKL